MKEKNLSYEDALKELEEIVEELEKDEISLNESVNTFKRGVELYKYCNNLLSNVEGQVKLLLNDGDDEIVEIDFFEEDEDESF